MKRKKVVMILSCALVAIAGIVLAADHNDAPAVKGGDHRLITFTFFRLFRTWYCF